MTGKSNRFLPKPSRLHNEGLLVKSPPYTQDVNWTYIRRSEEVLESSERLTYVQFTSCVYWDCDEYTISPMWHRRFYEKIHTHIQ